MKVGFIGLGIMGRPMAKNMVKAGVDLMVADLNKEAVADVVAERRYICADRGRMRRGVHNRAKRRYREIDSF